MPKILVLYCNSCGHIEAVAQAQAAGAARIRSAPVTVKRVAELTPPDVMRRYQGEHVARITSCVVQAAPT